MASKHVNGNACLIEYAIRCNRMGEIGMGKGKYVGESAMITSKDLKSPNSTMCAQNALDMLCKYV